MFFSLSGATIDQEEEGSLEDSSNGRFQRIEDCFLKNPKSSSMYHTKNKRHWTIAPFPSRFGYDVLELKRCSSPKRLVWYFLSPSIFFFCFIPKALARALCLCLLHQVSQKLIFCIINILVYICIYRESFGFAPRFFFVCFHLRFIRQSFYINYIDNCISVLLPLVDRAVPMLACSVYRGTGPGPGRWFLILYMYVFCLWYSCV